MSTNPLSYQSANAFPAKLLRYANNLSRGLYPIHLQLIITNKCNLKCPYCSCGECDRSQEMEMDFFVEAMDKFVSRGLQSVTITGGGEPQMHQDFDKIVDYIHGKDICLGLVTNGALSHKWPVETFHKFEWIRVSFDQDRIAWPDLYWSDIGPKYSFSYVYSSGAEKTAHFQSLVSMAKQGVISHLRVVSDITKNQSIMPLAPLHGKGYPKNVILQDRSEPERGVKSCWFSMVKPALAATGMVYPCCGVQYAIEGEKRSYPSKMCLGTVDEYMDRIDRQEPFNGSVCDVCYYGGYNGLLDAVANMGSLEHPEFI